MTSESVPLPDPQRATPEDLLAHAAWVRRLARALVGDAATADDVVQDTWLTVLRHPPAADRPVRPWLARVVANVASNRRRSERRRADHETMPPPEVDTPSPQAIAAEIEMQRLLLDAIDTLGEAQRSTLVRHYFHGQGTAAIARADGVSETTVRTRIAHAIEALRKKLDDSHRGDRSAWMVLVIPCARHETHVAATATATVAGTVVAMDVLVKVGIAAVVLVVGLGVYEVSVSRTQPAMQRALSESSQPIAPVPPLSLGSSIQTHGRVELSAPGSSAEPSGASPTEAIVEARVIDTRGNPIGGATMTCVTRNDGPRVPIAEVPAATSDIDGHVRIAVDVAALPHQNPEGATKTMLWWTDVEFAAPSRATVSRQVSFAASERKLLGDIVLADGGDIEGFVVDSSGAGVPGALVTLTTAELELKEMETARVLGLEGHAQQMQVITHANGSFTMRGVTADAHRVWAMPDASLCALSDAFVVHAGEHVQLPPLVVVPDLSAITGIVVDASGKPSSDVSVCTAVNGVCGELRSITGTDGRFVHKVMSGNDVELEFDGNDGDAIVPGIRPGTRDLRVVLHPPRWIDVHVHDHLGQPLAVFTLQLDEIPGRGNSIFGVHDARDGTRRIRAPTRPFLLTASAEGCIKKSSATLDPNDPPKEISFELEPYPTVRGRVVLGDRGVAGVMVWMLRVLEPWERSTLNSVPASLQVPAIAEAFTAPDGSFAFTCRASGTFVFDAVTIEITRDANSMRILDVVHGEHRTASGETPPITIDPAHPPTDLVIALSMGGSLEGRILARAGDESSFGFVELVRATGEIRTAAISSGGAYNFDRLTPGRWWILRADEDITSGLVTIKDRLANPTAREVNIVEGEVTRFDLDVSSQPAPVLNGRLTISGEPLEAWAARIRIDDSWMYTQDKQIIAADGSFRLRLHATGTGHLVLEAPTTADRARRIEVDVPMSFGENVWNLAVPMGTLAVSTQSTRTGVISHVHTAENGAKCVTEFQLGGAQSIQLDRIPAGAGLILDASGKVLAEVDVPSGGQAQVSLH
jgi:RNA polymerase sigma-70 factor (ECF subfamily)